MNTNKISLYQLTKDGGMQIWSISVQDWIITINYGRLGGSMQTQTEDVPAGLAGRTRKEQIISRVKSRINKQRDKGYKSTQEEAKNDIGTDVSGNIMPMLAHPLKRVARIDWSNAYVQPKYDGHRMMTQVKTKESEEMSARSWSRKGKPITTVGHIHFNLLHSLKGMEQSDCIIDGEAYYHGAKLQTIASWLKRQQNETSKLYYVIFDIVEPKLPFHIRLQKLKEMVKESDTIRLCPTIRVFELAAVNALTNEFIAQGFEGAILRHGNTGYEIGERSSSLVKVKKFLDDEFKCVGITESRDGWAVLELETKDGKKFGASAPGTVEEKTQVLHNKDQYLGRMVTLEYSQLTKDGIPFHPVATRWRVDI